MIFIIYTNNRVGNLLLFENGTKLVMVTISIAKVFEQLLIDDTVQLSGSLSGFPRSLRIRSSHQMENSQKFYYHNATEHLETHYITDHSYIQLYSAILGQNGIFIKKKKRFCVGTCTRYYAKRIKSSFCPLKVYYLLHVF